jgi:membrane-associated phospholipid phosphatase
MRFYAGTLVVALSCSMHAAAQVKAEQPCDLGSLHVCARHILQDEGRIVTSPIHVRASDLLWIVPLGVATGVAIHYDAEALSTLGTDQSTQDTYRRVSDIGGVYVPIAGIVGGYAAGAWRKNDYLKQTAVLSAEAITDGLILNTGLKYAINRQTPSQGNQKGEFWPNGTKTWPDGQSMPSGHSLTAWTFAHVVASRYPSWHTKVVVYGLAATVSASRVVARQHFPSDVLVGGALGYLIGGYVVHARGEEGGKNVWMSLVDTPNGRGLQLNYTFGQGHRIRSSR